MNNNDKKEIINLIDNLNAISFYELNEHSKECYYEIRNAIFAMSTDASQEPYEDMVSRQAILEIIKNLYPDMPVMDIMGARRRWLKKYKPYFECENAIEQLPPVTPKKKMGRWIKHDIEYATGHRIYYDCSLCGCAAPCTETADKIIWKMANYCPDCGARMENDGERWR